jgi:hypothetical protein
MEEEIVTLNNEPSEEPWCSFCNNFTDYKRKWTTYPRSDLDGGTYSETVEVPHCVHCGSVMFDLGNCRKFVWGVRLFAYAFLIVVSLLNFFLFDITVTGVIIWFLSFGGTILMCKLPVKSREALRTHSDYQKLSNLRN